MVYSRSAADADDTVTAIRDAGGRAEAFRADVTDDGSIRTMAAAVREALGPVSVLVNNAGGTEHIALDDLESATDEIFERLFRLNTLSAWHCARAVADDLKAADDGCVVNVGSASVSSGRGSSIPYVVSKAALRAHPRAGERAGAGAGQRGVAGPGDHPLVGGQGGAGPGAGLGRDRRAGDHRGGRRGRRCEDS